MNFLTSKNNERLLRLGFFFLLIIPFTELSAQKENDAVIIGTILDSATDNGVENAIVFLANTPLGTSTGTAGTFRIANVPVGTYQLVVSQVGYKRQIISVNVVKPESLFYEVKLQQQPIRTQGVEILGERPETEKPNPTYQELFFPKDSPNTYCIFGTGSSVPIGIFYTDSAIYMYSLDTTIVDSERYIRLWLLYKNLTNTPFDLNPIRCAKLHMHGKKYAYPNITPDSPSQILADLNNEDVVKTIIEKIGKDLKEGSAIHKILKIRNSKALTFNFDWGESLGLGNMDVLNTIFENSVNVGILKQYNINPGASVNGFVYFPFPGLNWKATESTSLETSEYIYTVEIVTQNESKFIEFSVH